MSRSSPLPSNTAPNPASENGRSSAASAPPARPTHSLRHRVTRRLASPLRWLHIYLSMVGLAVVLFFSVTGLTLNHPEWFAEQQKSISAKGQLDLKWLHVDVPAAASAAEPDESRSVAKLEVVEFLRKTHNVRGALSEFRVDDQECTVSFKAPGYAADAFINRTTGKYDLTQNLHGFVAVINDLHKGRDTGNGWKLLIDVSAVLLILISLTGVALLLYIKRKRIPGLIVAVIGAAAIVVIVKWLVP